MLVLLERSSQSNKFVHPTIPSEGLWGKSQKKRLENPASRKHGAYVFGAARLSRSIRLRRSARIAG